MHQHFQAHILRLRLLGRLLATHGNRVADVVALPEDGGERRIVEAEERIERMVGRGEQQAEGEQHGTV